MAALCLLLAVAGCTSAGHEGTAPPPAATTAGTAPEPAAAPAGGEAVKSTSPAAPPAGEGAAMSIEPLPPRIERVPGTDEHAAVATRGGASSAVPEALLAAARADLEQRLAAQGRAGPIRVLVAEAVTWPDGALGCPRPGVNYTMALVPGHRVVFAVGTGADERHYAYHGGRRGPLAYCATPGSPVAASTGM